MIRKSEDLPESAMKNLRGPGSFYDQRIKKGHPRIDRHRSGDFFCSRPANHYLKSSGGEK
jgi:hypothetical protein